MSFLNFISSSLKSFLFKNYPSIFSENNNIKNKFNDILISSLVFQKNSLLSFGLPFEVIHGSVSNSSINNISDIINIELSDLNFQVSLINSNLELNNFIKWDQNIAININNIKIELIINEKPSNYIISIPHLKITYNFKEGLKSSFSKIIIQYMKVDILILDPFLININNNNNELLIDLLKISININQFPITSSIYQDIFQIKQNLQIKINQIILEYGNSTIFLIQNFFINYFPNLNFGFDLLEMNFSSFKFFLQNFNYENQSFTLKDILFNNYLKQISLNQNLLTNLLIGNHTKNSFQLVISSFSIKIDLYLFNCIFNIFFKNTFLKQFLTIFSDLSYNIKFENAEIITYNKENSFIFKFKNSIELLNQVFQFNLTDFDFIINNFPPILSKQIFHVDRKSVV